MRTGSNFQSNDIIAYIKRVFLVIFSITGLMNLMLLTTSLYSYYVLNKVFITHDLSIMFPPTAGVIIVYILIYALHNKRAAILSYMVKYIEYALCEQLMQVGVLNNSKAQSAYPGKKMIYDLKIVKTFLLSKSKVISFFDAPWSLLFGAILGYISIVNLSIYCSCTLFYLICVALQYRQLKNVNLLTKADNNFCTNQIEKFIDNYIVARTMNITNVFVDRIITNDCSKYTKNIIAENKGIFIDNAFKFYITIAQIFIFLNSVYLYINNDISVAVLLINSILSNKALTMLCNTINVVPFAILARTSFNRLMLSISQIKFDFTRKIYATKNNIAISLIDVSHSYPGAKAAAIKNIALDVVNGDIYAIVGNSGCGKSTLLKMLGGAIELSIGNRIYYSRDSIHSDKQYIVFCEQEAKIQNGIAIKDAISIYLPSIVLKDVISICEMLKIHNDILSLINGYDTIISDSNISSTLKKKIQIASLLLLKSNILIFDDPTAFFDNAYDKLFAKILSNLRNNGNTIIISTNKRDIVRIANKIVTMSNGEIVNIGSYDELVKSSEI